ncbi:MAG: hypothetical protein N2055_00735 [Tepidimonas taiwanensis]|nr:hypothetical protein [Tepidimonas taiwanensis]
MRQIPVFLATLVAFTALLLLGPLWGIVFGLASFAVGDTLLLRRELRSLRRQIDQMVAKPGAPQQGCPSLASSAQTARDTQRDEPSVPPSPRASCETDTQDAHHERTEKALPPIGGETETEVIPERRPADPEFPDGVEDRIHRGTVTVAENIRAPMTLASQPDTQNRSWAKPATATIQTVALPPKSVDLVSSGSSRLANDTPQIDKSSTQVRTRP